MIAVFFDMDGVLVDSEEQWRLVEGPFFQKILPKGRAVDSDRLVGLGVHDLYRFLRAEHGLKETPERFLEFSRELAQEVYQHRVSPVDGAQDLIDRLREAEVPVGLVSSSPREWVQMVLDRFHLAASFETVVTTDDVEGEGKPSPRIYQHACARINVPPGRCVAIEDSRHGVTAAKGAGLLCVGLRNGANDRQDLSASDLIVSTLRELDSDRIRRLLDPDRG